LAAGFFGSGLSTALIARLAAGRRAGFSTVAAAAARFVAAADTCLRPLGAELVEEGDVSETSRGVLEDTNNLS
jgi:hypothetical protein